MAAGNKNRLKMKNPVKLWPVRPATRAGQNAMAIQMIADKIRQRTGMAVSPSRVRLERACLLPGGSAGTHDVAAPGRPAHHPGITPGGVICGDRDDGSMGRRRLRGGPRACLKRFDPHRGR
jgi:hypothetical protein